MRYKCEYTQCEYATDVVFKRQADLAAIYGTLTRKAVPWKNCLVNWLMPRGLNSRAVDIFSVFPVSVSQALPPPETPPVPG